MITFNDVAYCPYFLCNDFKRCEIALDEPSRIEADLKGMPIAIITERPPCYDDTVTISIK